MIQYDLCSDRGSDGSLTPVEGRYILKHVRSVSSWAERGEGKVFQAVGVEARGTQRMMRE